MPELSIIIPVYNKGSFLRGCINSVLGQSFTDFELILINDGSTDGSGEKCEEARRRDMRVKVVHQRNEGVSRARNVGLSLAIGKYIGFVDADDIIEMDMFELLIKNLIKYGADVSVCGVRKKFPSKVELFYGLGTLKLFDKKEAIKAYLRKEILHSIYDKVYKSEIAKSIQFEGSIYEDLFYNFLILKECQKVVYEDVIKYNYIIRENSVSMSPFSIKYMDTVNFSKRMVSIAQQELQDLSPAAMAFDVITNISLLNIILLSGKKKHYQEYKTVTTNLKNYSAFINDAPLVAKHKFAFKMFNFSPTFYRFFLYLYCYLTGAEVLKRT